MWQYWQDPCTMINAQWTYLIYSLSQASYYQHVCLGYSFKPDVLFILTDCIHAYLMTWSFVKKWFYAKIFRTPFILTLLFFPWPLWNTPLNDNQINNNKTSNVYWLDPCNKEIAAICHAWIQIYDYEMRKWKSHNLIRIRSISNSPVYIMV